MAINPDFRDLFAALSAEGAEYLLIGAHAVMLHTSPRYTKGLDLWVRPTRANGERVHRALARFGAPLHELTIDDLATEGTIFQLGVEPNRVDIVTMADGLDFESAWQRRVPTTYGGVEFGALSLEDLITNKRAANRPQDQLDVARLEDAARKRR